MSVQRSFQLTQAFSLFRQDDLATPLFAADINRATPFRGFAPTVPENSASIGDSAWYGKGHSFATFYDVINRRYVLGSREYSMSDLSALFAFGMIMGKVQSTQTFAGVWDHKFTYKEPSTDADGPDCVSTTFMEKLGGEGQFLYSGVVLNEVAVTGRRNDHVTLSWSANARKRISNSSTFPGISSVSYMKTLRAQFVFGDEDASPEVDISAEVLDFELRLAQNPDWLWMPGTTAADEVLCSRVLVGKQGATGSLRTFVDANRIALFDNNTSCKLRITCLGSVMADLTHYKTVTIEVPHLNISAIALNEEGNTMALQCSFTEDTILKPGSDDYISVTVRTDENADEILVADSSPA